MHLAPVAGMPGRTIDTIDTTDTARSPRRLPSVGGVDGVDATRFSSAPTSVGREIVEGRAAGVAADPVGGVIAVTRRAIAGDTEQSERLEVEFGAWRALGGLAGPPVSAGRET